MGKREQHMGVYYLLGGTPLSGTVKVQKSKNAVLPMIAAAVLQDECVVLSGCPRITDVEDMIRIIVLLGGKARWENGDLFLNCSGIRNHQIERELSERTRSSVLFLGSLLARFGRASIHRPGGCTIGRRPTDFHLMALSCLGAEVEEREGMLTAEGKSLSGSEILFPGISVGATENALLAAVLAEGVTVLGNPAKEPEIVHLCRFLRAMGARIEGEGSGTITVTGVSRLHGCRFVVPGDRIAAGTFLFAGAITRGKVSLIGAPTGEMKAALALYEKMGGQYHVSGGTLITDSRQIRAAVPFVETAPYPGFPTDLQSLYLALAVTLEGSSRIRETVFESRFGTVLELQKMGADLSVSGREIRTETSQLKGADVTSPDLRGGAALVLAGLAAEGITTVRQTERIERGYENFVENFRGLGAEILWEKEQETEESGTGVFWGDIRK